MHDNNIKVLIAGIPNCGKSTIVSELSGVTIRTANYPGTTVSINRVEYNINGIKVSIIDLPGTYSLRANMVDETVAAREILRDDYDGIIAVGSALDPEQTLYLLVQILELGRPVILVLNMVDLASRRGFQYDIEGLSKALGIPVLPTVAAKGAGLSKLKNMIIKIYELRQGNTHIINYGKLEKYIETLSNTLGISRGLAIEVISDNPVAKEIIGSLLNNDYVRQLIENARREIEDVSSYVAAMRWNVVRSLINRFVIKSGKPSLSRYDELFMNPKYGPIISILLLFVVAETVFLALEPLVDLLSTALNSLPINDVVGYYVTNELIRSLIIDGVWNGISTLIDFIPYVFGVALLIAFIEDSGLIVRISFPIERWLRRVGIPSRGLIYLIAGSGCNVPAITATKAMPSTRDRMLTALMIPYIPCTARFVIISLIAAAVLPHLMGLVVVLPYAVALIGVIIISSFSKVHLKFIGGKAPYSYTLPPLVLPLHKAFIKKVWHYTYEFISRAGALIVIFIIVMWFLSISGPSGVIGPKALDNPVLLRQTWLGIIGNALSPLLSPIGIPWQFSAALVYGYIFKEVVLSTLALMYGVEEGGLIHAVKSFISLPSAIALIVFTTFYSPCIATLITEKQVVGLRLTVINTILQFLIALGSAYAAYHMALIALR
ncbi:ferrous iron transport protein B [Vulcanisaeta souniana]|uniref:Ferrous iron transport protein B n=1 Tax=Vulcanisaeta souniana JCM 11219 TaxID=1293586 RepID=A0A830E045_9CREN|nr:ferrous iron transport protein B [Vulcanisaeta souniana]BDR91511.1 ferrous iron transporter B [Vulcanisaeta souniana JCM 11219]GGI73737.1 ferrous iron transporter B [Vulcanisaeta souniana JCM 11219]